MPRHARIVMSRPAARPRDSALPRAADGGTHLAIAAQIADARRRAESGAVRWRGPRTPRRIIERRAKFRLLTISGGQTHNPAAECAHIARRLLNSDTVAGRAENAEELALELPPDRPGGSYSIPALLEAWGGLERKPYDWPVWKVRSPQRMSRARACMRARFRMTRLIN
jgi:hypothetical protein